MKIMCGNYGFKNWYGRGIRSSEHNLRSSENKAWKVQVIRDLNPWTLQYRCIALSTELISLHGFITNQHYERWKENGLEQSYIGNRRYPPLCPLLINMTRDNLLKEFIKYADILWKLNLFKGQISSSRLSVLGRGTSISAVRTHGTS